MKLEYSGFAYISRLFGFPYETLQLGLSELRDEAALRDERIRQRGGGRKSAFVERLNLTSVHRIVAFATAYS